MDHVKFGKTGPGVPRLCIGRTTYGNPNRNLTDAVAALSLHLAADEINILEAPYVPHNVAGFS